MKRFTSIANGDCLFNSCALHLFFALKNDTFLANEPFLRAVKELLQKANLPTEEESVIGAFKSFIQTITHKRKLNWMHLQLQLAPLMRQMMVEHIHNDRALKQEVLNELNRALEYSLEISIDAIEVAEHFRNFDEVKRKIVGIKQKNISPEEQKITLKNWFNNEFFNEYLQGEKGLLHPGGQAGELECKVISKMFNVRFNIFSRGEHRNGNPRVVEGFRMEPSEEALPAFDIEYSHEHWNALLSDKIPNIKRTLKSYNALLSRYKNKVLRETQDKANLVIMENYGTFVRHHFIEYPDLSVNEYLNLINITLRQYQFNILPRTKKPFVLEEGSPTIYMQTRQRENSISDITPPPPSFDPARYFGMFLGIMAAILLCTHCMVLPVLFPFLHCSGWLTHSLSFLASLILSFTITEKYQNDRQNGFLKEFFQESNNQLAPLNISQSSFTQDVFLENTNTLIFGGPQTCLSTPPLERVDAPETNLTSRMSNT